MLVLASEPIVGRSKTAKFLALLVGFAVLCMGLLVGGAQPAFAAGQTVSGTIVFPVGAPAAVREALDRSVPYDSQAGVYLRLSLAQSGSSTGWELGTDANVTYNPTSGAWSISNVPNGNYRLNINVILPNNGYAPGTSQELTVNNVNPPAQSTVISESGRLGASIGLCGWKAGDDVKHYVKNRVTNTVYQLDSAQSGEVVPSTECPPEVSYGNHVPSSSGIPAGDYIAYTVWNGNTHYYAGYDLPATSNAANAAVVSVQNWTGTRIRVLVPNQVAAGTVNISGTAKVGQTLTALTSGWTAGSTFTYQWLRGSAAISGATASTYALKTADEGAQVSVRVTGAKSGYENKTKTSAQTAKVVANGGGTPSGSPFIDVPKNHKFYEPIKWMYAEGLSTGVNTNAGREYQPKVGVSREAMAAFLYRLEGAKHVGPAKSPFVDVKKGDKFYNEIAWMYSEGLSTGVKTSGGRAYQPKVTVSREAMAAFIYRLERATAKAPSVSPFGDMSGGDKFYKEISWMSSAGLSTGIKQASGKRFYEPKAQVSREAMAAFLYRLETQK